MKYKVLFLDYDGTIAPIGLQTQVYPPSTVVTRSIHQVNKKLAVCLASGRVLYQVRAALKLLKLNSYSVLLNGAQIVNAKLQTVWQKPLTTQAATQLYQLKTKYKLAVNFSDFKSEIQVTSLSQLLAHPVADFFFTSIPPQTLPLLKSDLSQIKDIQVHGRLGKQVDRLMIDVTDIHATKARAIAHVLKLLDVKREQVIGVGDGMNDYPLLQASGLKIAMGNAVPELKAIADFIAPSVEEDGVATVIEKFILNQ